MLKSTKLVDLGVTLLMVPGAGRSAIVSPLVGRRAVLGACILVVWLALVGCAPLPTDTGQLSTWAQTSWNSIHRDARNSDHAPFATTAQVQQVWRTLEGAAILVGPAVAPDGTLYVTSGQGVGHSHLHALAPDGSVRWQSAPQTSIDDLDSFAVASGVLIDNAGHLYVADSNQFWAFYPNGTVKWVRELPVAGEPFISSLLTPDGRVGGITTGGKVVLFQREDGAPALPVQELPTGVAPAVVPHRQGMWEGGLLDPALLSAVENAFFGLGVQVANTPAIHPQRGRIFITAAGPQDGDSLSGRLYGIDIIGEKVLIATETPMGSGSGSSPTISPDGHQVYAVDGSGTLLAVDTGDGAILWTSSGFGPAASVAVGADGVLYSGSGTGSSPGLLLAVNPDGSDRWRMNYDTVAAAVLPSFDAIPPFFPTGQPTAKVDSVVSVSSNHLWVALILGYDFVIPPSVRTHQSRVTVLAALDPGSGAVLATTPLMDTSEATVSIGADGRIYVAHASLLSSLFYYGINPLLPPALQTSGPPPGGLTALAPVDPLAQVAAGLAQADADLAQAQTALTDAVHPDRAHAALDRSQAQLQASTVLVQQVNGSELTAIPVVPIQAASAYVQGARLAGRLPAAGPAIAQAQIGMARQQISVLLQEMGPLP